MGKIAKIAVSAAIYSIDKLYDYMIPPELYDTAAVGMRVIVPFGRGNRRTEGVILAMSDALPEKQLKSIESLLDESPVLTPEDIKLAVWMRERYFCKIYDAIKVILPVGMLYNIKSEYHLKEGIDRPRAHELAGRSKAANTLVDMAFASGGTLELSRIREAFSGDEPTSALKALVDRGVLETDIHVKRSVSDKTHTIVSLNVTAEEALDYADNRAKKAPLQAEILRLLAAVGEASSSEICYFTGASGQTLRSLEKKGLVEFATVEVLRRPQQKELQPMDPPELNFEQKTAFEGIDNICGRNKPAVCLLRGVTGSGKTQVYISLIYRALERGRSALLLVPEIALTPQMMNLFTAHFGDSVAILHSRLRDGERLDEWKRIQSGRARVAIGARSAVFAPMRNLGLIIIDEEHEQTYKSERPPRYHTREVAKYRCNQANAVLVLGSATPSFESAYNASQGVYHSFSLRMRYNERDLPRVIIADLRAELLAGNNNAISSTLKNELIKNIERREQSILFLNRRGSSRLLVCPNCGYVPKCDRCSVSLTYHAANNRLMCHYCGRTLTNTEICSECGGSLRQVGYGTQRVEAELHVMFPGIELLRMDTDTISARNTHEKILSRFREENVPILIGTQMVTKGLDFENVTLVGVLDADLSLHVDNFRANERTFSLITQVVGRAGRGEKDGRAVIQTLTPDHEVINLASVQDYDCFYKKELVTREMRSSPPFFDIITVSFSGPGEKAVLSAAARFREKLIEKLEGQYRDVKMQILGPAPASVARVNNVYRYRLTLSCVNNKRTRTIISTLLKEFERDKQNAGVLAYADVNAYD